MAAPNTRFAALGPHDASIILRASGQKILMLPEPGPESMADVDENSAAWRTTVLMQVLLHYPDLYAEANKRAKADFIRMEAELRDAEAKERD